MYWLITNEHEEVIDVFTSNLHLKLSSQLVSQMCASTLYEAESINRTQVSVTKKNKEIIQLIPQVLHNTWASDKILLTCRILHVLILMQAH